MGSFPGFCSPGLIQAHAPPTSPGSSILSSPHRPLVPFGRTGAALLPDGGEKQCEEKWEVGRAAARAINHSEEENEGGRRDGGMEKAGADG